MSVEAKVCVACGKSFTRPIKYSRAQWDTRVACSRACGIVWRDRDPVDRLTRIAFASEWRGTCLIYKSKSSAHRYVNVGPQGSWLSLHRFVYEQFHGRIPEGWHVHHRCEQKHCVNPAHLQALSPGDHSRYHGSFRYALACRWAYAKAAA